MFSMCSSEVPSEAEARARQSTSGPRVSRAKLVGAIVTLVAVGALLTGCGASASSRALDSTEARGAPARFTPQSITRVGTSDEVVLAGTVPCGREVCAALVAGSVGPDGLVHRWSTLRAPPVGAAPTAESLDIGSLVFANRLDAYDVVSSMTPTGTTRLFATTTGGREWRRVRIDSGRTESFVASAARFYAVTVRCVGLRCEDQLASSEVGTTRWSTTPIPRTTLDVDPIGLAVVGSRVLVNFDAPVTGAEPLLLSSRDGQPPFHIATVPALQSVSACGLHPEPDGVIWAACPTGMLVSYLRSPGPNSHFAHVWTYAGTGGGGLVPVTGEIAYRYTGVATFGPARVPGDVLQRSTDGGAHFITVGRWPFASNVGTSPQLLFLSEQDGFGLGFPPSVHVSTEARSIRVLFETSDGGRHWRRALT